MWRPEQFEAAGNNNQVVPIPPNRVERPIRFEIRLQREFEECEDPKNTYRAFTVKKRKNADGTLDLYNWVCTAPGPSHSPHEGGLYKFYMHFPDAYPFEPPVCKFKPGFFHANVGQAGILYHYKLQRGGGSTDYTAASKMCYILHCIVTTIVYPDPFFCASSELRRFFLYEEEAYKLKVKRQVQEYDPILIQQEFDLET